MKQFFIFLLLFPLSFTYTDKDSTNDFSDNKKNSDYTKWIVGLGIGRYVDCGGIHDVQDVGVLFKKYKQNGLTYGGSFNIIHGINKNSIVPAVNGMIGYNHKYFEVSGGLGLPNIFNALIRIGPEDYNLNIQGFSNVPYFTGKGVLSAGISITKYFEAGAGIGIPVGYYLSGIIPLTESNKIRMTIKFPTDNQNEYGFSVSLIHFNF